MDGNGASSGLLGSRTRPNYPVRILLAEDDEDHAELARRAIQTCHPPCELAVVGSLKAARASLPRSFAVIATTPAAWLP